MKCEGICLKIRHKTKTQLPIQYYTGGQYYTGILYECTICSKCTIREKHKNNKSYKGKRNMSLLTNDLVLY